MQFIRPFQRFDPIKGELHEKIPPVIKYYFEIAREILVNRNYDEIEYAISAINYLSDGGRELLTNSNNEKETSNTEIETISIEEIHDQITKESSYFTPSSLLYGIYSKYDIKLDNDDDYPNANWAEYFAVLALAEIAELQAVDISSMHIAELSSRSAGIGEAIAYANLLLDLSNIGSQSGRKALSLNNRKAAIKRHEKSNEWKARFIRYLDDEYLPGRRNEEINRSAAAKSYFRDVIKPALQRDNSDPLRHRQEDNVIRMLLEAERERR